MRHVRIAFVAVVALLLLAGCGTTTASTSNGSASGSGGASKLCQGVATVNQSLAKLGNIGENSTVGDVKAIQQKLTPALNALAAVPLPSGNASQALSNLKAANDQLAAAIKDLPDSATVGQQAGPQLQALKDKVSQAQTAMTKVASTLKCTS